MNCTALFASPRPEGNTAALLHLFQEEWEKAGGTWTCFSLYDLEIQSCHACLACQKDWMNFGCTIRDDMHQIFTQIQRSDLILLATPIYSWYCTAPMKAAMDRMIYGGCKYYGGEKGPSLLAGKRTAVLTTCGYPLEKGADLFEQGVRRWCRHGGMDYLGLFARRHLGYDVPFMDPEKEDSVREFARDIYKRVEGET